MTQAQRTQSAKLAADIRALEHATQTFNSHTFAGLLAKKRAALAALPA
ncbi:hypothetical protein [Quatrionicoccus australiensis]|nr:hypothetical protein [Quatrionicoccus australiensis]MCB4359579.1 hypothetical protein [Quatrionicoccus australiensis]